MKKSSELALVKAVVDTNVVVSGVILRRGRPLELVTSWRKGALDS